MRDPKAKLMLVIVAGIVLVALGVFAWGFSHWLRPLLRMMQNLGAPAD